LFLFSFNYSLLFIKSFLFTLDFCFVPSLDQLVRVGFVVPLLAFMFPTEYLIILIGSAIFGGLGLLAHLALPNFWRPAAEDKSLTRLLIWTTVFCCWLFWLCVFLSQMYPLIMPTKDLTAGLAG